MIPCSDPMVILIAAMLILVAFGQREFLKEMSFPLKHVHFQPTLDQFQSEMIAQNELYNIIFNTNHYRSFPRELACDATCMKIKQKN